MIKALAINIGKFYQSNFLELVSKGCLFECAK